MSDGESGERPGKRAQHPAGIPNGECGRPYVQPNAMDHSHRNSVTIEELAARLEQVEKAVAEKNPRPLSCRHHHPPAIRTRPSNGNLKSKASGLGQNGKQEILNLVSNKPL